ncbi:hypothetical protein [Leptospira inadai]|uniref:hypothetical protein n=1 Tax=Leptospira inadai TaxID=29506 RepID=UPI000A8B2427|nr:hypothetical protein [Leptospira inadai]
MIDNKADLRKVFEKPVGFGLFVVSFFLVLSTINTDPELGNVFYSSDSLFFSNLYSEFIVNRNEGNGTNIFRDWTWTPSPYFFPDLIGYFLIRFLVSWIGFSPVEFAQIGYAAFQWSLFVFGSRFLLFAVDEKKERSVSVSVLVLGFTLGTILLLFRQNLYLFLPGFHGGLWALLPWSWGFYFKYRGNRSRVDFLSGAVLSFLCGISDPLYLPTYLIPVVAETVFRKRPIGSEPFLFKLKNFFQNFFPSLIGIFGSIFAYRLLARNKTIFFPFHYFSDSVNLDAILRNPLELIRRISETTLRLIYDEGIFFAILITGFVYSIFRILYRLRRGEVEAPDPIRVLSLVSGLAVPVCIIVIGLLQGVLKSGEPVDRYFGGIVGAAFYISVSVFLHLGKIRNRILLSVAFVLFCFCILFASQRGIATRYYPAWIKCLDRTAEEWNLKRGIAGFWRASPIRNFSRMSLIADPFEADLSVTVWQNSFRWYDPGEPYSFAILDPIKTDSVEKYFGKPRRVVPCSGISIFIMGEEGRISSRKFLEEKQSQILLWKRLTGRLK